MKILPYLLIVFIALLGIKNLFQGGFYTSHDGRHQIIRLMHFHRGLIDGQLPVRWAGTAFHGYGYPLFIFTYRLPFYIAEVWYIISPNLGDVIKFAFIVGYILSGITMFLLAKDIYSSSFAGVFSAILYLWTPYRFVNIFVRASLGEATTFMFLPLLFLSLKKISNKKSFLWIVVAVLSLSGLILSHIMTLTLWFVPLFFWLLINLLSSKMKFFYLRKLLLIGLLTLLLTAYYWLPAFMEKKYTQFNNTIGDYYKSHFVTMKQLIYSPWGYGFSLPGTQDDQMSFQVGIANWLIFTLMFVLTLGRIIGKAKWLNEIKKEKFSLFFIIFFIFSIILMLPVSSWYYEKNKQFLSVDIPWRFLGITVFCSALLLGKLYCVILKNWLRYLLIFCLLAVVFYSNRNHLRINQAVFNKETEYFQSTETSNEHSDYAPIWAVENLYNDNDSTFKQISGFSSCKILSRKSNFFRFYCEVKSENAQIELKTTYYPGWQLFIDSQKNQLEQKNGKIIISLDQGNHLVSLVFRETNLRLVSNWLSIIGLIILVTLNLKIWKKRI